MFMRSGMVLKSAGVCALALIVVGAATTKSKEAEGPGAVPSVVAQASPTPAGDGMQRNLSLQPEASKLSRRLGRRFLAGKREKSVLNGTLTIGSELRVVETTRTQTDDGEEVEITTAASPTPLTWNQAQGARSGNRAMTRGDRELIERLVFDSPDQFVLAQLRGASYFVMARNVRPEHAGENYSGPLWNVVRVSVPERDEGKRPLSKWRLYFINTVTGLIDRIESEVDGERTVAEFSGWTDANGERLPTEITWTKQGHRVMHYRLSNFSHFAQ